jgi:hypothetical protein
MSRFANTVFDTSDRMRLRAFTSLPLQRFIPLRNPAGLGWRIDIIGSDGIARTMPRRFWRWRTAATVASALSTAHNDGAWIGLGGDRQ